MFIGNTFFLKVESIIFCQIDHEIIFFPRVWSLPPSHVGAIVETIAGLAAGQSLRNHFRQVKSYDITSGL
jgi:hypothetical protein